MATEARRPVDPSALGSWLEIRPDNTVAIRTGVPDFGQGTVSAGWRQIVAEELRLPFEAVEIVTADTDTTPDGLGAYGYISKDLQIALRAGLGIHPGSPFGFGGLNVQKVAAYAFAELMERASRVLGAPPQELNVVDGVVRSGSGSVTYAELVRDAPLDVQLSVAGALETGGVIVLGTPPVVPVSEYRVIGSAYPDPRIPAIVDGTLPWVGDVRLPGMLHGRMVHPPTLGSTLVSVGQLPADKFPSTRVMVRGNFVGVVAPDEWEAIRAAQALAGTTVWTEWQGLPGSDRLIDAMLDTDWIPGTASTADAANVDGALAAAPRRLGSYFALPFYKHVPISPEVAVADVRGDGTVHVWAFSAKPQDLRLKIAAMLGMASDQVIVHFAHGAGSFGRTNRGDGGAEAEAVLLSQASGRPVRLQWMRDEDFAWSKQQAAYLGELSVGLDERGRMIAFKAEHRQPGANDDRLLAALLAGLPTTNTPLETRYLTRNWVEWPYDRVPAHVEIAYGAANLGHERSPLEIGLRHHSMRTPQQLQQVFGVECMVNEAAAAAGTDPIQYRIDHTTDRRLVRVLDAVRRLSHWDARQSPSSSARARGGGVVRGRGVGIGIRHGSYWAGVAEIAVDLDSGGVVVERYYVAADVGVVVNPRLLRRTSKAGRRWASARPFTRRCASTDRP